MTRQMRQQIRAPTQPAMTRGPMIPRFHVPRDRSVEDPRSPIFNFQTSQQLWLEVVSGLDFERPMPHQDPSNTMCVELGASKTDSSLKLGEICSPLRRKLKL